MGRETAFLLEIIYNSTFVFSEFLNFLQNEKEQDHQVLSHVKVEKRMWYDLLIEVITSLAFNVFGSSKVFGGVTVPPL